MDEITGRALQLLVDGWLAGDVEDDAFARVVAESCAAAGSDLPSTVDLLDRGTAWNRAILHSSALRAEMNRGGPWPDLVATRAATIERSLDQGRPTGGDVIRPQVTTVSRRLAVALAGGGSKTSEAGWHASLLYAFLAVAAPDNSSEGSSLASLPERPDSISTTSKEPLFRSLQHAQPATQSGPESASTRPKESPGRSTKKQGSAKKPWPRRLWDAAAESAPESLGLGAGEEIGGRLGQKLGEALRAIASAVWNARTF